MIATTVKGVKIVSEIIKEGITVAHADSYFLKNFTDFTSGNKMVDEIIKNPIYIPPKSNNKYDSGRVHYYEWIPWESLKNINKIAEGGFSTIYKATYIDVFIEKWSMKHYGKIQYIREYEGKFMKTPVLNNIRAIFINKGDIDDISRIRGITQNLETFDYGIAMNFALYGDMRKNLSSRFYSTTSGLSQIHRAGMIHRDLHSGNILQYAVDKASIGDLGLCQPINNPTLKSETTTTEENKIFGVIPYIPPDVLRGEKYTMAGDIYSLGMLLWELATGKPPFHDLPHDHFLVNDILKGNRPEITFPLIPPCIAEIIEKCWDANPFNHPTTEQVAEKLGKLERSMIEFKESDKYLKEITENKNLNSHSSKSNLYKSYFNSSNR
ncbi:hypothetical protein G9A89_010092 [Geosiphon pyriformis]|nr:hypothetical protein G9A89_010092 [Geosiphon pyriformis]